MIKGKAVSPGVALGKVYLYKAFSCDMDEIYCAKGTEPEQKTRLEQALIMAEEELTQVMKSFGAQEEDKAKIFLAHKEILEDEEILELADAAIFDKQKVAECAVIEAFEVFIELISGAKDAMIAARAADFRDVRNRLVRILRGEEERNLSMLTEPVIVVARDLLASDTATLNRANVLGILTEMGSSTSHTAIIANSYRIPAVLGVPNCMGLFEDGEIIGLDAFTGEVHTQLDDDGKQKLQNQIAAWLQKQKQEQEYLYKEPCMADGTRLQIGLNIGSCDETEGYDYSDFVGLLRTEFLYMQSEHMPTEEEQYIAYKTVLQNAQGKAVTLRTLDIGGDKTLSYMPLPKEENPFLGKRALRLCLAMPELFRTQLRAALRASVHGELWIMIPMVGSIDDIRHAKEVYNNAKAELKKENIAISDTVKFGIMIEIPAIAVIADIAALEVDFASVGTNDLCQYLCAVDRMNPELDAYYQSFSPAMVRTLAAVIDEFDKANKPISVCGEMAGSPQGAVLLAGLGLQKLSMSAAKIAAVKATLAKIGLQEARQLAQKAKAALTQEEVFSLLDEGLKKTI